MNNLLVVALEAEFDSKLLPANWDIIYTGVGKVQAAIALNNKLRNCSICNGLVPDIVKKPNLIVNYGTAGSLHEHISGLNEVGKFVQRDMMMETLVARGSIPFTNPLLNDLDTATPTSPTRCGTGDSFVTQHDPWFDLAGLDCVDMEGWALAYVAKQHSIPFRSWKYISDTADENAHDTWHKTVSDGQSIFYETVLKGTFNSVR